VDAVTEGSAGEAEGTAKGVAGRADSVFFCCRLKDKLTFWHLSNHSPISPSYSDSDTVYSDHLHGFLVREARSEILSKYPL
jgi:hypothetical protein